MGKVLHVVNGDLYSGAERVQHSLASMLPKYGYHVDFFCLKSGAFQEIVKNGPSVIYTATMKHRMDLLPAFKLRQLLSENQYDIIHSHTPRGLFVSVIANIGNMVPLVHHVHSPTARDTEKRWRRSFNAAVESLLLHRASHIVAVSRSMNKYIRDLGHSASATSVVYNGVPTRGNGVVRSSKKERLVVGVVALFRPRKGLDVLLESLALLKQKGKDLRVLCVGGFESKDYEEKMLQYLIDLQLEDLVDFTGFTEDVYPYYREMDILVLPSLYGEGLPMVVLEAMSEGVPVIVSDVEGAAEAVRNGIDGLVVKPGNVQELASALELVIDKQIDITILGRSARCRQSELYSDDSMAKGIATVYNQLLGQAT